MEACPTCGAAYRGTSACRRCGTQFERILAAEAAGRRWAEAAETALRRQDPIMAWKCARQACQMHRTPAALRVLALAALSNRRYADALRAWEAVRSFDM